MTEIFEDSKPWVCERDGSSVFSFNEPLTIETYIIILNLNTKWPTIFYTYLGLDLLIDGLWVSVKNKLEKNATTHALQRFWVDPAVDVIKK